MHRWYGGGGAIALALTLLAGVGHAQTPALEKARKALDAGEPQQAVEALKGATDPAGRAELAEAQMAAGLADEALKTAQAAAGQTPSAAASRALALVHAGRFEYGDAQAAIDAGLQRSPNDGGLLAAKGRILWQRRHTKSAIEALTAASKNRDARVAGEAQYWLGRLYMFRGWQSEGAYPGWHEEVDMRPLALAAFRAAAQARPSWYAPRLGLATALQLDGNARDALPAFDAALDRAPNMTAARAGRWRALKALNRTAEIETEVAAAAKSSDVRMLAAAREGYDLLGKTADAQALAARISQEFPASPAAAMLAAAKIQAARRANQHADVIPQAEAFIAAHRFAPQLTDVYEALVAAYQATPSAPVEKAAAAIEGNVKHLVNPAGYFAGAAQLQARRAPALLDRSIQLAEQGQAASETFVKENLGSYKLEGKSNNSIARGRSQAADLIGWAHFLKGDLAQAEARLSEAERLTNGGDQTNRFHMGELARAQGRLDQAREHYLVVLTFPGGAAPMKEAARKALAEVHTKLGNEAAEFDKYLTAELDRRREERRTQMLQSMVGKTAPELKLPDMNGQQVDLKAERGNVVLLNFFASW
jgi:hypothetical protein